MGASPPLEHMCPDAYRLAASIAANCQRNICFRLLVLMQPALRRSVNTGFGMLQLTKRTLREVQGVSGEWTRAGPGPVRGTPAVAA